ncbi:hypothetical protein MBM_05682 [Drepanopeziza brunnea f. sp. 'multigermtubi' MB_m1]|uniref:RGS domain-containing protein n=1 Tax=Marssonina brunnea f. sp. multigermtubi (strain MB_m1) TaxID=1072389 RepID=K1X6V5_MARBU|nr:uncharacterized protein MBM_05682 [Drepanopeziza brunnea f. sp. 'multigermtubi' MB_m1]EKD16388.1 hypothetical protein MBM_05682 [Drepanopeziza brunnea f. sp. 'multigermtubi' MB_m1]
MDYRGRAASKESIRSKSIKEKASRHKNLSAQSSQGWYGLFAVQNLWKTGSQIMTEYISTNGEHALNLSHIDREMTLYALERSNHPSAMHRAQKVADDVLRNDSYPRFLRVAKPAQSSQSPVVGI